MRLPRLISPTSGLNHSKYPRSFFRFARGLLSCVLAIGSLGLNAVPCLFAAAPSSTVTAPSQLPPGADLFSTGAVCRLRIEIAAEDVARLRRNSREYVPAIVREGTNTYDKVGVHLKGATGSFRPLEDKPALTLHFGKFTPAQRFHGLQKLHLNNSVEDPSYLNELLGSELFRVAGVPAPRVTHALVELNGRKPSLYLLKEGFTEDFLGIYFQKPNGGLYEPGEGHDAGETLKLVSGDEPDQAALKALATAAREPNLRQRWQLLEQILDLERFVSFMAMEIMLCHRDGYCLARNNFRIYHNPGTGKVMFFPHGMDQLFGKADAAIQDLGTLPALHAEPFERRVPLPLLLLV